MCVCVSVAVHERDYVLEPVSHETAGVIFTPSGFLHFLLSHTLQRVPNNQHMLSRNSLLWHYN